MSTSQSQLFPHSDSTATSNVTLTTRPSSFQPGESDLDLLDQGSVASNGLASVFTNMGCIPAAESAAPCPSPSMPSTPSEKEGDLVEINLDFTSVLEAFNPRL